MTQRSQFLDRGQMMQGLMNVEDWDGVMPIPAILSPRPLWTGKQLFSLALPSLDWERLDKDDTDVRLTPEDTSVRIRGGELLTGTMTKKALGRSYNSLLHGIWKRCGAPAMAAAINAIQRVVDHWLTGHSFSTGISDCVTTGLEPNDIVPKALEQVAATIAEHRANVAHPLVETKINEILNCARDSAGEHILKQLPRSHGMKAMAASGSKGS